MPFVGLPTTVVLDNDPDLAEGVAPRRMASARPASLAATERLPVGDWDPGHDVIGGHGLLVLDGLLVRRISVGRRLGAELLAAGDLLQPWSWTDEAFSTLPFRASWHVLIPASLAVFGQEWTRRMAPFPEVAAALARRALERYERELLTMSSLNQRRLDRRLWLLLWQLAEREGRVHPDGVHLDLPLSHGLLAELTGARRPSVSTALTRLAEDGRLRRQGRGWLLMGDPPAQLQR